MTISNQKLYFSCNFQKNFLFKVNFLKFHENFQPNKKFRLKIRWQLKLSFNLQNLWKVIKIVRNLKKWHTIHKTTMCSHNYPKKKPTSRGIFKKNTLETPRNRNICKKIHLRHFHVIFYFIFLWIISVIFGKFPH